MSEWIKYPHIPNLVTMEKPRSLLGKKLYWTFKEDGSCMSMWINKDNEIIISSKNLEVAKEDLKSVVISTPEYGAILSIIDKEPELMVFFELCKKGRSITGACEYDRTKLVVFDIFNRTTNKFLPYIRVHQYCYQNKIPVVKLFAETRHTSMKDLLKFKNYILKECEVNILEGMVIKTNPKYLGALGKLKSRGLVETYKEYTDIGRNMVKKRRYVKILDSSN